MFERRERLRAAARDRHLSENGRRLREPSAPPGFGKQRRRADAAQEDGERKATSGQALNEDAEVVEAGNLGHRGRAYRNAAKPAHEALYLADRLILMTDGPEATVGDVLRVPFPRPRVRAAVLEHPQYDACYSRVLDFLEHSAQQLRPSILFCSARVSSLRCTRRALEISARDPRWRTSRRAHRGKLVAWDRAPRPA